jgi:DNA uptake protein ComE-like DNA-binding protein
MASAVGKSGAIDLNNADQSTLEAVGLGAAQVRSIIDGRPFVTWEELKLTEGIGDELVERLRRIGAILGAANTA